MYPSPLTRWLPVFLWMGVIFWFSSIPELESGFPSFVDLVLRKLAHMGEYAVLALLTMRALGPQTERAMIFKTLLIGIGYAATDELHESYVDGREAAFTDVVIDGLGVLIGMGFWEQFKQGKQTKKRHSRQTREPLPAKK